MLKCLNCNKAIPPNETIKIEKAGVDPFCSKYCSEVYGGIPLPYDSAAHNRLKWEDIHEQRRLEYYDTVF